MYFKKPNVLYNAIIITTDQYSPQNQLKDRLYVKRAGGILVTPAVMDHAMWHISDYQVFWYLTTIGGAWYFWKGICPSKALKPVTLSGNATFTKV